MEPVVVDVHTHAFPDDIAARAISMLEGNCNIKSLLDGTISALKASMEGSGISRSVVLPIATKPSQVRSINDWAHWVSDGEIICFGTIHPDLEGWRDEIRRIKDLGLIGIKIHPDYQNFFFDDERILPIYEELMQNELIILAHAGVDIGLPEPVHATPDRISRVIEQIPGIRIIAAHLGSYLLWDDVERYLVGKDIFLDISYVYGDIEPGRLVRIMEEHGFDKILFGTDSPWRDQKTELEATMALGIEWDKKEKILSQNALRLFGGQV